MHFRRSSTHGKKPQPFHWQHLVAWLGGILCALVPYVWYWELGSMQIPVRFGAGNLGFNLMIGTGLCALGAILGGYWWRFISWMFGQNVVPPTLGALGLLGWGISGVISDATHHWYYYGVGGWLFVFLLGSILLRDKRNAQWPPIRRLGEWFRERNSVNAIFFVILFLTLLVNNSILIFSMDAALSVKLSALFGRICNCGLIVGIFYLLVELTMRAAPRYFRWAPWLALATSPLLVAFDSLIGLVWNRALVHVVNNITQSGEIDLVVELKTSGLDLTPVTAWLLVGSVFVAAFAFVWACWYYSRKLNIRASLAIASVTCLLLWLGLTLEQGIGAQWKSTADWQQEREQFYLSLSPYAPPMGVGEFRVEFFPKELSGDAAAVNLTNKPDIHILMIESMRADALRPDVTPFLCQFRDEDCQKLGKTWSTSNATHLSWFAAMHSRIPVYWREELEAIPDRNTFRGAMPLQQLQQAGYAIEVRAVCDLNYKDFGLSNFGLGQSLATVMLQADDGSELEKFDMCERERINFESLKQSLTNRPDGGGFYFTALDAPHYNYYWHDDFDPPFKDYDPDTRFPLNPTEDELQRVINRYWNACAWVDEQVKQFVDFLKREGRYDNSIIILTGDHGEEFQEQGGWFHCSSLKPEQTNVPLLIKWPKGIDAPEQESASHLDLMPSIFHAIGMPDTMRKQMAGVSLLEKNEGSTVILTTAFAGKSRETMVLRRGGYKAVFYWEKYWESRVPETVVLRYIEGPEGRITLSDPKAYADELRKRFPDAFQRFFKSFEVVDE